jgi:hypothetical protein
MKFTNIHDYRSVLAAGIEKLSPDEVRISDIEDVWDGPLSGMCIWKEKEYYFACIDQLDEDGEDRWPRKYLLISLTDAQKEQHEREARLFIEMQKETITREEYLKLQAQFQPQLLKQEQIAGWLELAGDTESSLFMNSYLEWQQGTHADSLIPLRQSGSNPDT